MEEKTVWRFAIITLLLDLAFVAVLSMGTGVLASSLSSILLPVEWLIVMLLFLAVVHAVLSLLLFLHAKERGVGTALLWAVFAFVAGFIAVLFHRVRARLAPAIAGFWHNPSLLGVMVLEFIARMVLIVVFILIDGAIIGFMNKDALAVMPQSIAPLLNLPTILVTAALVAVELLVLLYINSFFSAGFYGMSKDFVKDGSTRFAEFIPSVKRYWHAMFRFLFVKFGLTLLVSVPGIIAFIAFLSTTAPLANAAMMDVFLAAALVSILFALIVNAILMYGEAALVFEDAEAWESVKRSGRLVRSHFGTSIVAFLTVLAVMLLGSVVVSILLSPFDYQLVSLKLAGDAAGYQSWSTARSVAELLLNIVSISLTVVSTLFVFLTYNEISGGRPAAKPVTRHQTSDDRSMPRTVIKRKPVPAKKHK